MPTSIPLSAGAIAGLAGGAALVVGLIIFVAIWVYRRRHVDVNEIPIRRSKLGSRLGFRIFGDSPSRNGSRRGSEDSRKNDRDEKDLEKDNKAVESGGQWLDKSTIGRPKPAWLENGLLSVPKPSAPWVKKTDEPVSPPAPWVDKGTISAPRPGRPTSAEPLGRLSGMGLGMGYLNSK
ncbi:hypothetical protein K469DRAFT_709409 [Zopfia rhizophila CBS 207.26]|uniref:Uncharacterized protein n=1 Tax=Zopfia rhizophila CBS 207.26 TaxID=1314779 RepID=A0A6A6ET73_9PEZI|nr:hypothetical protein K469DRAFT_709409 [Zopfia rhizophila CBS 207.26]